MQRAGKDGGHQNIAAFPLLNRIAPEQVLVSANGDLVAIDDWRSWGHGDHVVVLYRKDGTVVKQYSLEQLLPKEHIRTLPQTITTIWWGGAHFLDEKAGHIVLMVMKQGANPSAPQYVELRLDLTTGEKIGC